jgi:hypothetical protein
VRGSRARFLVLCLLRQTGLVLQLLYSEHRSQGRPAETKGRSAVHEELTARQAVLGMVRENEFWLVHFKLNEFRPGVLYLCLPGSGFGLL